MPTGARYTNIRTKRLSRSGNLPTFTKVGTAQKLAKVHLRGGSKKTITLEANVCNLFDPKTKKHTKAKLLTVVESPANKNYSRRNIITKGAIVNTDKGNARVTSRPGQTGSIEAVLIK